MLTVEKIGGTSMTEFGDVLNNKNTVVQLVAFPFSNNDVV